jgi:hypothetical protein
MTAAARTTTTIAPKTRCRRWRRLHVSIGDCRRCLSSIGGSTVLRCRWAAFCARGRDEVWNVTVGTRSNCPRRLFRANAQRESMQSLPLDLEPTIDPATASFIIRNSRPRNGWLWPTDRAGSLVPFYRQPLQYVEFGAVPFGVPTIHQPCVLPPRAWLR